MTPVIRVWTGTFGLAELTPLGDRQDLTRFGQTSANRPGWLMAENAHRAGDEFGTTFLTAGNPDSVSTARDAQDAGRKRHSILRRNDHHRSCITRRTPVVHSHEAMAWCRLRLPSHAGNERHLKWHSVGDHWSSAG